MTIKTILAPSNLDQYLVIATIKEYCGCKDRNDGDYNQDHSQYILGPGDTKILEAFFSPSTGCTSVEEESRRRKFWRGIIEQDLLVFCELTAPITFWALNDFAKYFDTSQNPDLDTNMYGVVNVKNFLDSIVISRQAVFTYSQLADIWHNPDEYDKSLYEVIIPWIASLPFSDIFIQSKRNMDPDDEDDNTGGTDELLDS